MKSENNLANTFDDEDQQLTAFESFHKAKVMLEFSSFK